MRPFSISLKGLTVLKAVAVVALIMVWILIDKGNALGQVARAGHQVAKQSATVSSVAGPSLRDGMRDGGPGEEDGSGDFNVYPNPVKDDAVFDFEFTVKGEMPYEITDALGRLMDQGVFVPDVKRQTVNLSNYRTGMYLIRIRMGDKAVVRRIIKQ